MVNDYTIAVLAARGLVKLTKEQTSNLYARLDADIWSNPPPIGSLAYDYWSGRLEPRGKEDKAHLAKTIKIFGEFKH